MTTTSGIWIPGDLVTTNRALSDARAAGWFQGFREAMVRNRIWRPGGKPPEDRYAEEAQAVRRRAALQARAARLEPVRPGERVKLRFAVQGYPRWDASGGMLAAKWAEDGLVDAGVIPSDRFNVAAVEVAVCQQSTVIDAPRGVLVSLEVQR